MPSPTPLCTLDPAGLIDEDIPCASCGYNLRTQPPGAACPECGHAIPASLQLRHNRAHLRLTLLRFPIWARVLYAVFGAAPPIACFYFASTSMSPEGIAEWQSGDASTYAALFVGGDATRPLIPLAAYAVMSLLAILIHPRWAGSKPYVRGGIYAGVLFALIYALIHLVILPEPLVMTGMLGVVGLLALNLVVRIWLASRPRVPRDPPRWLGPVIAVFVLGAAGLSFLTPSTWLTWLIACPVVALVPYSFLAVRIYRTPGLVRPRAPRWWIWLVLWWTAWIASWAIAIREAILTYHQLPTTPPSGCYIATAAARGHPRFVGSAPLRLADGRVIRVNDQLRTLKAGELALRAVAPRTHRVCRHIYDALGPRLARMLKFPLLADMAFVALAPAAWLTRRVLRRLVPGADRLIARLYRA